jgi:predicted TIM-barrel fold metal-dependent hydrolase
MFMKKQLTNKIIDIHSHAGISIKNYSYAEYPYAEYPYAETLESLYYKQLAHNVDINVVFPFAPELFYDIDHLIKTGTLKEPENPRETIPYQHENTFLLKELYEFLPEFSEHFLPFVCFSPKSHFKEQLQVISNLAEKYDIFGIKVNPALCQAPVKALNDCGELFSFAEEQNIPLLFHSSCIKEEQYSYATDILDLADKYPGNRFCLAHCIGFHKYFLKQADAMSNVWVDTAALKIQVQLAFENSPFMASGKEKFDADFSDHKKVMQALVQSFPKTIIWGSDSPAYSYIVDRINADGSSSEFRLKARYEDEINALNALPQNDQLIVANNNSIDFLFQN